MKWNSLSVECDGIRIREGDEIEYVMDGNLHRIKYPYDGTTKYSIIGIKKKEKKNG